MQNQHLDPVELVTFLLKENDLSQSDLARIVGRSRSYVSEILSYKKRFSSEEIRKISEHFKIQQSALNRDYQLKNSKPSTEKQSLTRV